MMKRLTTAAVAALMLAPALPAVAGGPVVVELFTSQGCSSCPPADAILGELAGRDDVIALSMHVDYWDYLGWADVFAKPAHTERQRGYAHAAHSTMVYTPQMVIGGRDQVVGTKAMQLADQINKHKNMPAPVTLKLSRDGSGALHIEARRTGDVPRKMLVQLIRYLPEEHVDILTGENAGKTITYRNVVASLEAIGKWNGDRALSLTAETLGDDPSVVLIQEGSFGPILAAARID